MNGRRGVIVTAAWLASLSTAHAQSVINWPTPPPSSTVAAPAVPPPVPDVTTSTAPPAPAPAPAPPAPVFDTTPPPPPVPIQGGYVEKPGQEPEIRLDVGRVSPDLLARYAQQPGESQEAYIARMGQLYQQTQASMAATEARDQAYLRSITPRTTPAPASTAASQP
ncbi:MAG: hypothetical protein ACREPQ_00435 [Rhodanobacter sp.]